MTASWGATGWGWGAALKARPQRGLVRGVGREGDRETDGFMSICCGEGLDAKSGGRREVTSG